MNFQYKYEFQISENTSNFPIFEIHFLILEKKSYI